MSTVLVLVIIYMMINSIFGCSSSLGFNLGHKYEIILQKKIVLEYGSVLFNKEWKENGVVIIKKCKHCNHEKGILDHGTHKENMSPEYIRDILA